MIRTHSRTTSAKWFSVLALAGVAVPGMAGCGGDNSLTDSSGVSVRVTFAVSPNPIVPQPSTDPDPDFEWTATYSITLTET